MESYKISPLVNLNISSILCSSFAMFGIILFLGGVFRLAGQRRRGGGNIRTVNFGSIFLV